MATDSFKPKTIDITDLDLELYREGQAVEYAILSLQMLFSIGTFPVVNVVVSTGADLYRNKSRGAVKDILKDVPEGAIGTIKIKMESSTGGTVSGVLFCGYVSAVAPALATSIYSVTSSVTIQLVCAPAAINATPCGALEYFNAGGNTAAGARSMSYAAVAQELGVSRSGKGAFNDKKDTSFISEVGKLLQTSPGHCATKLIDFARGLGADSQAVSKLEDAVVYAEKDFGAYLDNPRVPARNFLNSVTQALMSSPATTVFNSILAQLFLGYIPETAGELRKPCKVITWPINAWEPTPAFRLKVSDILAIQSSTRYRLDQRVDLWYVTLPPIAAASNPVKIATYGPPATDEAGKARCMTHREFAELLGRYKDKNTSTLNSYAARHLFLPGWLSNIPARAQSIKNGKNTGAKEVRTDHEVQKAVATQEDIGKRVAINGFLQHGCAIVGATLQIPLYSYFKLLPYLGLTGTFEWPDAMSDNAKNIESIKTSKRYGLLHGLTMQLTATGRTISVSCTAQFSSVHDEKMHTQFATEHPLYPAAKDLPSYQSAARKLAQVV